MQHFSSRRASRVHAVRKAARQVVLEMLEERTLLSGFVVTNTNNSGAGSLRQAILDANSNGGLDQITFDIPGTGVHTIKPTSPLPQITDSLEIHGESQNGYAGKPLIELDGSATGGSEGLDIKVGGNLIQGLDIHSFAFDAISLAEDAATPVGGSVILNNYIGTDPTGTVRMPNGEGINIVRSPHNLIKGNVLSGNVQSGLFIQNQLSTGNRVEGNFIGTDPTGMVAVPNGLNGVDIGPPSTGAGTDGVAFANFIGSADPGGRNIISGNRQSGIRLAETSSNVVQGNYIGVAADGVTPLGNGVGANPANTPKFGTDGVLITGGGGGNVIGGALSGAGNVISANAEDGVSIADASARNLVAGNVIGATANGLAALPNGRDGVSMFTATGNTIGGESAEARNVISGNTVDGIYIGSGPTGDGSVANQVLGNLIGLDVTGTAALPNQQHGVDINGGSSNVVGGLKPGSRNVISGNKASGISIGGSDTTSTQVAGNFIGTDVTGLLARPNAFDGIEIFDSPLNLIGGTTAAERNVIAGNGQDGILIADAHAVGNVIEGNYIGTDATGATALPNAQNGVEITALSGGAASGTVVGGTGAGARNVISGNGNDGVQLSAGVTANVITGNFIGTNASGSSAVPNARVGVGIFNSSDNTIGATGTASPTPPGNVISGNKLHGIFITGSSTGTKVQGNFIGTNAAGGAAVANEQGGIVISGAAGNLVGGGTPGFRNIVSGNGITGVLIAGAAARNNTVTSNYIGTDVGGGAAVPNGASGLSIQDAADNSIGSDADQRNVISGNGGFGVFITGKTATGNRLFGNFIGTVAGGGARLANASDGVRVESSSNLIGGIEVGQGNVVSGNGGDGIVLDGADATDNLVRHNVIGTDLAGAVRLGNRKYGVEVRGGKNNAIGGPSSAYGNTIAFNGDDLGVQGHGVVVPAGGGNSVRANSIYQNAGRGIDLVNLASPDTFTVNDAQDSANPADLVQDAPVATGVEASGFSTLIHWTLNSTPNTAFTIDFYSNIAPNPSGFGDGRTWLSSTTVTTNADGNVTFDLTALPVNTFVSSTATSPSGDTSEFSMIDSDADGLGDAWETRGIDFDEDGTVDLTLPGANPLHKDIYVEVDAMNSMVPDPGALPMVVNAFAAAPVANPDGVEGITLHAALSEVIPDEDWLGDRNGNGVDARGEDRNANGIIDPGEDVNGNGVLDPGDPVDQDPWGWFDRIKNNVFGAGGRFGDDFEQRSNPAAMGAKRLTYRYALFAKAFAQNIRRDAAHPVGGTTVGTSGIAEIGGNDFIITLGNWEDTVQQEAGTFMHELGHTLGLRHGGDDDLNFKPNYNSLMSYMWQMPGDWMTEDVNGNGVWDYDDKNNNGAKDPGEPYVEFDYNGDGDINDSIWSTSYSTTVIDPLNENNLDESKGINGIAGRWELVGPGNGHVVLQTGAVDWNQNGASNDKITTGIDINNDGITDQPLNGFDDWSHIQYYFAENPQAADGAAHPADPDGGELNFDQWAALNAQGDGPGVLEFVRSVTPVSEGAGLLTVTVIRGGGTHGTVSVDYSTVDGTAKAGSDYGATSGTLTFADGEYLKTFTVAIFQDPDAEHAESFRMNLSNPTGGAMLRPDSSATVSIVDDDLGGHLLVTNTNDGGAGSLRQAILDANNHPGNDLIEFKIGSGGVRTIIPLSTLPTITDGVTIDGTTQPGFAGKPLIEISGQSAPGSGLSIGASGVTVVGLVVNRFTGYGIFIGGAATNYVIEGNYIGTDVTGMLAAPNLQGIEIESGTGVIGGDTPSARNVISGNQFSGISVYASFLLSIRGNYIGVAADGIRQLGNQGDGVSIGGPTTGTTVGGPAAGDGNVIAFNGVNGIANYLQNGGHAFLSNAIYGNQLLGINLNAGSGAGSGVDLNDGGTGDGSSFDPQNYPVLYSPVSSGGHTTISGYLNSRPNLTYRLQFFGSGATTLSGFGQGEVFLGGAEVTTDANGHVDFTVTVNAPVADRRLITATATDPSNNTSEFSARLAVGDVLANVYIVNTTDDVDDGVADATHTSLREAILAANNHPGVDTIRFAIGSGVKTITPLIPLPAITDSVILDATTQPGYAGTPLIEISGARMDTGNTSGAPSDVHLTGLLVAADNSVVRGFVINRFYSSFDTTSDTSRFGGTPLIVRGDNNRIEGNFFGTDVTGTVALRNLQGMVVRGTNNRIGGTTPQARNVVSGNFEGGLVVGGDGNIVQGNFIGTDVTGTKAVPNGRGTAFDSVALQISDGVDILVGGSGPGEGNVISGNLGDGIRVARSRGTRISGNLIGTDVTGTKTLGNQGTGVRVEFNQTAEPGLGVTIGGIDPGARNVISNNSDGILLLQTFDHVVQGNYIGTDIAGTRDFGNRNTGITMSSSNTLIGGSEPGAGNLVSGNNGVGILITGSAGAASHNVIQGNRIGTQADGVLALGNGFDGVQVFDPGFAAPTDNLIGGAETGAGNVIAFNGQRGVNIVGGLQNAVLSNLIYSNGLLGIDLKGNGVTPNDAGDADEGPNNLQNYPVLTSAATDGSRTVVTGTLNSSPGGAFLLQFFATPTLDPSGHGQGKVLLGSHFVTTDASGNVSFSFSFPTAVPTGQFVTATATDTQNNTSEFATSVVVPGGTTPGNRAPVADAGGPYTLDEGSPLKLDGSHSDDPDTDPLTYTWDLNGDGVFGDATGVKPAFTWAQLQTLGIVNGPSSFNVRVRVDDGQGHVVTSSPVALTVLNVTPVADAGPTDLQVTEGDTVSLVGTFTDPGTADTHTLNWQVLASNGQVIADGTGNTFNFVPNDDGTYTVTFSVTDSDGATGSATVNVDVVNADPVATIEGLPATATVGTPIHLTANVTDASPADAAAGYTYFWDAFNEDDGTEFFTETPTFDFTPPQPGLYDIFLLVRDKDFGQARLFQTLQVNAGAGAAPTVTLAPDATINEGSAYTSTGSFADPDASDTWTATVDYGDGSGAKPLALKADKTFDLSNVYADDGVFQVVLVVTDGTGLSGSQTTNVTVKNVAPVLSLANPSPLSVGDTLTLAGSFTDPGSDACTATVDYGDGAGSQPLSLGADKTFTLSHPYSSAGNYDVVVTVTDGDGGTDSLTRVVSVRKSQTALAASPAGGTYGGATTLSATLASGGAPLAGKAITFFLDGASVGIATTDAKGVATLTNVALGTLPAGPVAITVTFASDGQFEASTAGNTLTIDKAPLVVNVDGKSRVYGNANPDLTGSVVGVRNNDNITAVFSTTATATSPVGPYAITASFNDPSNRLLNYTVSVNPGTLAVLKTTLAATGVDFTGPEGSPFSGNVATFTTDNPIAAADDFTVVVDWGDGHTSPGTVSARAGEGFSVSGSHTYADDASYPVSVAITDNAGLGVATASALASLKNVAPDVSLDSPVPVPVGSVFTLAGSFADPGADTWSATVDYGDGGGNQPLALNADHTYSLRYVYQSAGNFTVTVRVTDDDSGAGSSSATAVVNKLGTSLSVADAAATYGGTTTLSATLTAGGSPLANRTVVFNLNGATVGSADTDANGVATLAGVSIGTVAAGTAGLSVSFAGDAQDAAATGIATLSVARAPLAVSVNSASRVYGNDNPALTGSIVGVRNGDPLTASFSTPAAKTSPVGTYAVTATLLDPSGKLSNYDVTINTGMLTVLATTLVAVGKDVSGSEGANVSGVVATFTSNNPVAAANDFAVTITWGDGRTSTGIVSPAPGGGFQVRGTNTYADSGTFDITISVKDNAGQGSTSATAPAIVSNVAPTPAINGLPTTGTKGTTIFLTASATDPSPADTAAGFAFTWAVTKTKDGVTSAFAAGSGPSFAFTPDDDGVYAITLTATDQDGGSSAVSRGVTVAPTSNAAPVVSITGPATGSRYSVGVQVTFTGAFSDADSPGTHTALWTLSAPGLPTITFPGTISGDRVTASYTFNSAVVYSVALAVTDDQGATGGASTVGSAAAQVVLFDAGAGKITGGGFIKSPAGSLASDPKWTGKASFGFNAQYKKGGSVPTGELQFNAGGFDFHADSFDWLVVSGATAQLKGTGTANGHRYSFLLTTVDGAIAGGPDRFRLTIWDPTTGAVIYDSQFGAPDDAMTVLGGGNTTIHK